VGGFKRVKARLLPAIPSPRVKDKERRRHQASPRCRMVPPQVLPKIKQREHRKHHQRNNLLHHLQLHRAEPLCPQPVRRHLKQVLKEGNPPAHQNHLPQRLLPELQVPVPRKGHKNVREDQQHNGPHGYLGCMGGVQVSDGNAMTALADNLERLEAEIAHACRAANRPRAEIELMAVSKTYPAATIVEAAALGLTLFGENRVQEFAAKAPDLAPLRQGNLRIHLIGHLQSNKAQRAVELFDAIDSLDSLRLAERLNESAARLGKRLPVLIEVKLSPEETKAGLDPASAEAAQLLERLPDLASLETRGLMTIAPWGVPEAETRACFRTLRTWRGRWAATHPRISFEVLSMGMSGDFPLAIEEGATRIRVGTALFGKRAPYTGPA